MNFGDPTPESEALAIIDRALDSGFNFIDTANSYNEGESERIVGKALKQNGKRQQIVLATKGFSRVCEDSLRRLQVDTIDLYQLHRPSLTIPIDETLRALDDLVRAGKVRYIGCSTYPAWMVMEALATSEKYSLARYVSEQPPYNLLDRRIENELVPLAQKYGLAILPWSPLAMGILAGRYPLDGTTPEGSRISRVSWQSARERLSRRGLEVGTQVVEMAKERHLTAAQLALLWCKDQPGITAPIIGPRTLGHLDEFIPVLEMKLADEDRPLFDGLVHPGNAVADFFNSNEWMKARVS
jgi:aryl-alcohol dehydrogenase-like predicted oxidoreductase